MFLGIDLGTSEIKFLLLDAQNQVVASLGEALPIAHPHPLWSEQDPADWWAATKRGLDRLGAVQPQAMALVRAIGLAGQMHGAVLLDQDARVLRPAILWNDGRSSAQCEALTNAIPQLVDIAGNLAMPGFTAPKLAWVREHESALFARTAKVLLPKDWLRLQLSGEYVSEMSDAAGTLWLDVGARRWSDVLLAGTGMTQSQMPKLVEGSEVSSTLKPELAQRWGLPAGVVIAGGGGDNAASAVGMGLVRPGQGFVSLGTSGVIFVTTDRFLPNSAQAMHAFCHAVPGRWHQMSVMLSAAGAVSWATRQFGFADEAELGKAAAECEIEARDRAPFFLPYLSGERSPHNDAHAQAVLFGLSSAHTRSDIAYAVLEGVSLGLLDGFVTLSLPHDNAVHELSVVGGGSHNAFWTQLLADTLGVALTTHEAGTAGGALGAARLGWLAVGGAEAEVCTVPPVTRRFEFDIAQHVRLQQRSKRFRALYQTLRNSFTRF